MAISDEVKKVEDKFSAEKEKYDTKYTRKAVLIVVAIILVVTGIVIGLRI